MRDDRGGQAPESQASTRATGGVGDEVVVEDRKGRDVRRHRGALYAEYLEYYATFPAARAEDELEAAHFQRLRKSDWRRKKDKVYTRARGV